jgi:hypothetical protein
MVDLGSDVTVASVKIWKANSLSSAIISLIDSQNVIIHTRTIWVSESVYEFIVPSYSGPKNTIPAGYDGTYKYATLDKAQVACDASNDCTGIISKGKYTLRKGTTLTDSLLGEQSWLKVPPPVPYYCDQLLQHFHRVDEDLSIQGKWQGGSVTSVCKGWGTEKVISIIEYSFGNVRLFHRLYSYVVVPLYLVPTPHVNISNLRYLHEQLFRTKFNCDY